MSFSCNLFVGMSVLQYLKNYVWISSHHKRLYKRVFLKYHQDANDDGKGSLSSTLRKGNSINAQSTEVLNDINAYVERTMAPRKLENALEEILGLEGNKDNISRIIQLIQGSIRDFEMDECDDAPEMINFRCWCGIVALAERFILNEKHEDPEDSGDGVCNKFISITITSSVISLRISLHAILKQEREDFVSLSSRLEALKISEDLKKVLEVI